MYYQLFLIINLFLSAQYKLDVGKVFDKNLKIYPYFHIKNELKLNILFWNFYDENSLNNFLMIKCKDKIKYMKRSKLDFYLDELHINITNNNNSYNLIRFDTNKIYYTFKYNTEWEAEFECDLKYLELTYLGKTFTNGTFITNVQIYDTDETDMFLNFLKPIIFVDFKRENINSKQFTNIINLFHGGYNGNKDKIYSQFTSYYDQIVGVKWIYFQKNQFIEWDDKVFSFLNNQINKSFSVYINFDIISKFLDKLNVVNNDLSLLLYVIKDSGNNTNLGINFRFLIRNSGTKYILIINDIVGSTFLLKTIKYTDTINGKKQINKEEIGIKFFIYSYYKSNNKKFTWGFKKDSNFITNGEVIKYVPISGLSQININNYAASNYKHYIGSYNSTFQNFNINSNILIYFILNEYCIFSGGDLDEVNNSNGNVNLLIKGRYNILINNNKNLDRRFNLNNNNEVYPCETFKCNICDINNKCLYCYYKYYLDDNKNCILNLDNNKFVNEYSELIEINDTVTNSEFADTGDKKDVVVSPKFDELEQANTLVYLNFKIITANNYNFMNFQINNPNKFNYNIYFEEGISEKPMTISFNTANSFNTLIFQVKDNTDYDLIIEKNSTSIDCDNLENEIFNNDIDCNNICSVGTKYYYNPINSKKGRCLKNIKKGFYADSNDIILECPFNCWSCTYQISNKKVICNECIKGYNAIDGYCFFGNEFNCGSDKDLNNIFDNNNLDNIQICEEFCNLCREKNGNICSIKNLNFDFCDLNNIKILEPNLTLIKENINKCKLFKSNECVQCNEGFFLNELNLCDNCITSCIGCKDSFKCTKCIKNYFLENGNCYTCNSKFNNYLECTADTCSKYLKIEIKIDCDIDNCKNCVENNICNSCNIGYILNKKVGTCDCDLGSGRYFNHNNICLSCNRCKYCIKNNIKICPNCLKCIDIIHFKVQQIKRDINIIYDSENISINKKQSYIKIYNISNYIIFFKKNNIDIKVLDDSYNNSFLLINKKLINNLKLGSYINQNVTLSNYEPINNIVPIDSNNNITSDKHTIYNRKYIFPEINLKDSVISNSIIITSSSLDYSRFLIILMPFIIFLNQTALIILLDTSLDDNFISLLKLIKKTNNALVNNDTIFNFKEFKLAYNKISKKYKDNILIGEINLLDTDIAIISGILFLYYITDIILYKLNNNNMIVTFLLEYVIILKVIALVLFQSYLIKNYYKIIFFTDIFFELKNKFLQLYWLFWIQFYIILILIYFNYNLFFSSLFLRNYKDYKIYKEYQLIRVFVYFKKRETRNYNIIMNILDFFIVLFFMKFSKIFLFQIIGILAITFIKIIYWISLFFKYKKNRIFTQIVSFILLFNFYLLFFFNQYSIQINQISYMMIIFFLILNIWEILRIILYNTLKLFKIIKLKSFRNVKNYYENMNLKIFGKKNLFRDKMNKWIKNKMKKNIKK